MTDLEVIREFYQQIGWQDECLEIQESDRTLIKTDKILMLPSRYDQVSENIKVILGLLSKYPDCEPALIICGNPDTQTSYQCIERCFMQILKAEVGFAPTTSKVMTLQATTTTHV